MIMQKLARGEGFTDAEMVIARVVQEDPHGILDMSLAQAAERAHASQATVVRFCQRLGFRGFPAFKLALAGEIESVLQGAAAVDVDVPFEAEATPHEIAESLYALTYQTMRDAREGLDEHLLMRAARQIHRAGSISFFGRGESALIAEDLRQKLVRIGYRCSSEVINGFGGASAPHRAKDELAFVVSQYADSNHVYNTMDELIRQKIPTIMLCGTSGSPLSALADLTITVETHDTRYKIGSFAQRIAMGYVCDCLFGMVFSLDYEHNVKAMRELYEFNHARRLYIR